MAKVSPTDWFKIQGWMATEFDLTMGELVAFALVHTFTRPKEGKVYTGGVPYLAKFARCSTSSARRYLQSLVAKGLIVPIEGDTNGVPFIHYATLPNWEGKQKDKQKGNHKSSEKKESFTDSIVRQWQQNKQ